MRTAESSEGRDMERQMLKALRKRDLEVELNRLVERLKRLRVEKVILFGSLARGDVGRSSDIDLIVVKKTKERFLDRLEEIYAELKPNLGLEVLVYDPQEFEDMLRWNSFLRKAVEEGRILYEAGPQGRGRKVVEPGRKRS